jgi:hypothetical protein
MSIIKNGLVQIVKFNYIVGFAIDNSFKVLSDNVQAYLTYLKEKSISLNIFCILDSCWYW